MAFRASILHSLLALFILNFDRKSRRSPKFGYSLGSAQQIFALNPKYAAHWPVSLNELSGNKVEPQVL